jgi:hypothetical protein
MGDLNLSGGTDTGFNDQPQQGSAPQWNPIAAIRQKYPNIDLTDDQILTNLQDPAKFRSAFPEYSSVSDDDIKKNMGSFAHYAMSNPNVMAPPSMPKPQVQMAPSGLGNITSMFELRKPGDPTDQPPTKFEAVPEEQTVEGHKKAVYAREDAEGPVGQVAIGLAKAGGTLAKPVDDAIKVAVGDTDPTDYTEARGGLQTAGKVTGIAGAIVPAAVEAPVATALGMGTGMLGFHVGKKAGEKLGLNDQQSELLGDIFGLLGGAAGGYGGAKLQPKVSNALSGLIGGEAGAEGAEGAEAGAAASEAKPGIIKQIIKGEESAQPGAQSAIRTGVKSSVESTGADEAAVGALDKEPILKGNRSIVDDHLDAIYKSEKAAYKQVDDTVGFDLKQEKAQLANDKYKLSQLGNTDADINARGKLIEAINDSQDRITAAEAKLKAAGIDPKAPDMIHQQRMAGMEFKKALVKNTNPDGSVNVDGLLKSSQNLRFSKYGDRLQQFFGSKEAADNYMSQLTEAQKVGASAVKMQKLAKLVAAAYVGHKVLGGVEAIFGK